MLTVQSAMIIQYSPSDADANGVVIIPRERVREVNEVARIIEKSEDDIRKLIVNGSTIADAREKLGYHKLQRKI